MIKETLLYMLQELQNYKHDPASMMQIYVTDRLSKSFDLYTKELEQSIMILTQKHEKSLIKRLKKLNNEHH